MKKKIVCIIESLGPGGAERQLAYLAALLKQSGEDVELWTYYPNDFYKSILDDNGVPYKCISAAQNKYKRLFIIKRLLKEHHANTVISYMDTCSMMMCAIKLLGARFRLIVSERSSTSKLDKHAKLKYWLYKKAEHVIPNSYSEASFIKQNIRWLADKTTVIINYVDTERFITSPSTVITDAPLHLIGVGRISGAKNLLCLADAINRVGANKIGVTIDWYGDTTSQSLKDALVHRIEELGIQDRFILHTQDKHIENIYPKYEAFCLASVYEGFPNVVCEAMSCGLPVICSNVCDNGYLVEDGINGVLFDPSKPDYIAKAIMRYISEMRSRRKEVGVKNREKIMRICSKEVFVEQYKRLIYDEDTNRR